MFFVLLKRVVNIGVKESLRRIEDSEKDELTGLYNRRALKEGREKEATVIFVDLNGFKEINDHLSYEVGDSVLTKFSEILKSCSRKEDLYMRWGGDEFVIILPKTNFKEAKKLLERIEKKMEEEIILELPFPLSFSSGIVENTKKQSLRELINEAGKLAGEEKKTRKEGCSK